MKELKMNMKSSKRIIKVVTVIMVVMFFCPSFMISCNAGQDLVRELSLADICAGLEFEDGDVISEPQPVLLLLLIFPVVTYILARMKNKEKLVSIAAMVTGVVTLAGLFITKSGVEKAAADYMCNSKVIWGFTFDVIASLILCVSGYYFWKLINGGVSEYSGNNINTNRQEGAGNAEKKCLNCGKILTEIEKFCTNCGTEYENIMRDVQAADCCPECGTQITDASAKFCVNCGSQREIR